MDVHAQLATNIRRLREEQEITQEDLADMSGLHRTYIAGIESGKRNPTIAVLAELAHALEVTPADLLAD